MGDDTVPKTTTPASIRPKRSELLGEIRISKDIIAPLGGLNPYNQFFDKIGQQFCKLLIEHAGLQQKQHVLDVGCGTGRLTKALSHLSLDYCGFDINSRFVDYCRPTYPKARFAFCDVFHDEYNPKGKISPLTFEFPYEKHAFDLVFAIAVFNHFDVVWIDHYITQISRVLKPRGIFFGTFLLLNKQSIEFIDKRKKQPYMFQFRTEDNWHDYTSRPLFNVAHHENHIRRMFIKNNLMIKEPIRYGEWCESKIAIAGPDIIIAKRGGWV